jgi:Domain of unknown function (DUF4395)
MMQAMVDVNVPRFNQACVAGITAIAFVLGTWQLIPVVAIVLGLTRFGGPGAGLFTQTYIRLIRPRLDGEVTTEPVAPPRFAQLIGFVFLAAASIAFLVGFMTLGWVITLVVTALATLAAATRICVGCIIYEQIST